MTDPDPDGRTRAARSFETCLSVWITRAEPGASATAARVAAVGLTPLVAPLLSFSPLSADLDLRAGEALAFTSANAVARAAALTDRRDVAVFAVGDATAEAARAAGFHQVVSAQGDVRTLADVIIRSGVRPAILHPAARETAGDLVGRLTDAGVCARKIAIYETRPSTDLTPEIETALTNGRLAAALFHSPKAARVAAALLRSRRDGLTTVCAIGLSPACLEPLEAVGFKAFVSATLPNDAAMLDALTHAVDAAAP